MEIEALINITFIVCLNSPEFLVVEIVLQEREGTLVTAQDFQLNIFLAI